jgi:excisionase family DNA binding protein
LSTATAPIPGERLLYTRKETADLLRVSVGTVDNLIERGELHFRRVGGAIRGRVLIPRAELLRFCEGTEATKG